MLKRLNVLLKILWFVSKKAFDLSFSLGCKVAPTIVLSYQNGHRKGLFWKGFYHENRYYWNLYTPGYPARSFENVVGWDLKRRIGNRANVGTDLLIFAITKKCALNCEHCFEWPSINQKETYTNASLLDILKHYHSKGIGQLFFTGGEPLLKIPTLKSLIEPVSHEVDCWVISSGYPFSLASAQVLKDAGLIGIVFSLDHFLESEHDSFRGREGSFKAVANSINIAKQTGLMTALSLCPSREFVSHSNFHAYMCLAKKLGVSFIQIIEPKQEGRYVDADILLTKKETSILENLVSAYNSNRKYKDYPSITYPDFNKRVFGCGGGDRLLYLDTNGVAHPCPFCKTPAHAIDENEIGELTSLCCKKPNETARLLN